MLSTLVAEVIMLNATIEKNPPIAILILFEH
jgi:hypothetical protein